MGSLSNPKKHRVYKFPLAITGTVQSIVPFDGETKLLQPLSVGLDPMGIPSMWVLVDIASEERHWFPDSDPKPIRYMVVGTGQSEDIPEEARFLGTVQDLTSHLIWHVFLVGI